MSSAKKFGAVFDFDGTLTRKQIGALYKVVDAHALPKEAEAEMIALREKYLPKIRDGSLKAIDELYWLTETFEIYIRNHLTRENWEKALDDIDLRPGVFECLASLCASGVSVGIVSYGCANFIEHVLRKNNAAQWVDSVLAARLVHDDDGLVVGYDRTSLVYPDNKNLWSMRFAEAYQIQGFNLLAIGDSGGDRTLGFPDSPKLGIAESEEKREKLSPFFPEIVVIPDDSGSFGQVHNWCRKKMGQL